MYYECECSKCFEFEAVFDLIHLGETENLRREEREQCFGR